MSIDLALSTVVAALLVSVRISAVFLMSPLFGSAQVPARVRVLFSLTLSLMLVLVLGLGAPAWPISAGQLMDAMLLELLLGAMLAFGVFAAFGAFLFGGRILDFQMGFGVANLIDPATNTQSPLLGTALNMMAVAVFFLADGHHWLMRGLAYSLEQIPPGSTLTRLPFEAVVSHFGLMFVHGLAVVGPPVITLLLIDAGMAVAGRTMPQVNMFIVGLPLKIFVGLLMLAMSLNYMTPLLHRVFLSVFRYWQGVIQAAAHG